MEIHGNFAVFIGVHKREDFLKNLTSQKIFVRAIATYSQRLVSKNL